RPGRRGGRAAGHGCGGLPRRGRDHRRGRRNRLRHVAPRIRFPVRATRTSRPVRRRRPALRRTGAGGARAVRRQGRGPGTGAVAVLGDRDCSLQRRRQKLIEIAPAALAGEVRARLSAAAAALVRSAEFAGLATAEFLVQDDEIAFLEVNPRLQVEHTVTEQVTGLDLVEVGLRIADGATLAALALDVTPRGVAVQARVNAETLR